MYVDCWVGDGNEGERRGEGRGEVVKGVRSGYQGRKKRNIRGGDRLRASEENLGTKVDEKRGLDYQ